LTLREWAVLHRVINKEGKKGQEKPSEDVESTGRATFEQEGAVLEAELNAECQRIKVSSERSCTVARLLTSFSRTRLPFALTKSWASRVRRSVSDFGAAFSATPRSPPAASTTVREVAHETFKEGVEKLAKKHGVLSGKWLLYPGPDAVDSTWAKVVNALAKADGALAKTGSVHCAKVSSSLQPGGSR
jgi:hypothetical protein